LLAHRAETPSAQLIGQNRLINRFQQARAKRRMDAESRVDNLLRNGILVNAGLKFPKSAG
jgi:hypothetical protein